jgi:alkyl sulfatase BDS1-like metallo-beta-lactamase superfamily hydrolase
VADKADATMTTTRSAFDQILSGQARFADQLAAGDVTIEGSTGKLIEFMSLMDTYNAWFNIVTP